MIGREEPRATPKRMVNLESEDGQDQSPTPGLFDRTTRGAATNWTDSAKLSLSQVYFVYGKEELLLARSRETAIPDC